MDHQESIQILNRQEQLLVFPAFDETTAFTIGLALRAAALERKAPVAIDIRTAARRLFFTTLPGATPDNEDWARRKGNLALRRDASSLRVGLELAQEGRTPWPDGALPNQDYAAHGGGFPLRVQGTGVVACIAVSGLPSREDHELIVSVLAAHLGVVGCPATP